MDSTDAPKPSPAVERWLEAFLSVALEVLDGADAVLEGMDDDAVNASPLPGRVNSAFALAAHMRGMADHWGGSVIGGEGIPRDREAEFRATGTVAEARDHVRHVRSRLQGWARTAVTEGMRDPGAEGGSGRSGRDATPEWVLQHILHELAQHLGHMEVCRDVVAGGAPGR